ncbi:hypothetical protein [Vandammella animalimorsus]|uniref:hypothetical protein n=1 Tax=Vandammella animalimorsus TaxID=2029117 RepID=UPI00155372B3|nr:hypothetical protein [Vandammella animalimorsus]
MVVQRSTDSAREQIAAQIARLANFPAVGGNVQIRRLQGNELPGLVEKSVVLGIQVGVQHGRKAQLGQIRAAVVAQLPDPMPVAIGLLHFGKDCPQAQRRQPFARAGQASVLGALPTGLREHAQAFHRHGLRLGLSMLGIDDPKATAAKQQGCAVFVCLTADAVTSRLAHGTLHSSTEGALHPACAFVLSGPVQGLGREWAIGNDARPPESADADARSAAICAGLAWGFQRAEALNRLSACTAPEQPRARTHMQANVSPPLSMAELHTANVNDCQKTPGSGFSIRPCDAFPPLARPFAAASGRQARRPSRSCARPR